MIAAARTKKQHSLKNQALVLPKPIDSAAQGGQIYNDLLFMKLGFITPNLPGHLNPMTTLARHLQARNHEVVFLYSTGAAGLPFIPGPENDPLRENLPEVSRLHGVEAVKFSLRVLMTQTETILKSLPVMVEANGIDALVLDTVQFYAELGPIQLG